MDRLEGSPIVDAISYGIRAPNPHNTQAWKFVLESDTSALLYLDEKRLLPATDPPGRQIHIGAGCCIETAAIGMTAHGFETDVEYLPERDHGFDEIGHKPVARITLRADDAVKTDELADEIGLRQTNRKPYTGALLTADEAAEIRRRVAPAGLEPTILTELAEMRPLLDIFYRAMEIEVTTPHLYEETRIWFRYNEAERQAKRDGLSMAQLGADGLKRRLIEWTLKNGNPKQWFSPRSISSLLKGYQRGIDSARGVVLLQTGTNTQTDWLVAGRSFARLQLALTRLGLTSHVYSQVFQEYPEMTDLRAELDDLLDVHDPAKVQMAVRVGRAERSYVALRRDTQDFIVAPVT